MLWGGDGKDTFVFGADDWGHDIISEKDSTKPGDTIDFTQTTDNLTHVLSGGTLISGVVAESVLSEDGTGSSGYGYAGEQQDQDVYTGLVFLRARLYDFH